MSKQMKKIALLPTLDPKIQGQGADIIRNHILDKKVGEPNLPKGFIKKNDAERMIWSKINEMIIVINQLVESFSTKER